MRMTHHSEYAIFGHRAGSPGLLARVREPIMGAIMLYMSRINEGDQYVDVE